MANRDEQSMKETYGPWALIAGASQGMGEEFARSLANAGINCVLVARTASKLEQLEAELKRDFAVETLTIALDLTAADAAETMIEKIGDREIGLLIFNAGSPAYTRTFVKGELKDWAALVRMNCLTVMNSCYHFGGKMVERGRGGVILMGSHAALGGTKKLAAYTATKGFMANFGESLWAEWEDQGVDVLSMLIGSTDTPTMRKKMADNGISVTSDMNLASPKDVVRVALRELPNGPTFVFPDDEEAAPGTATRGTQRREHVFESSRISSAFIGD